MKQWMYGAFAGLFFGLCSTVNAAKTESNPVFLFTPQGNVNITISAGETKTISYLIQNNPKNPNILRGIGVVNLPKGVSWISGGSCSLPTFSLASGQSCTVVIQINGNELNASFHGGPQVSGSAAHRVYNSQPSSAAQLNVKKSSVSPPPVTFTVTASGDPSVTPNPVSQQVSFNGIGIIQLTVAPNYVEPSIINDTCGGSVSGTTYTTGLITSDCSVAFTAQALAVAEGPNNVFAVPGNGQATLSWTPPTNTGIGVITGYTVTYGPTSGTTFNTAGCAVTAPSLSCTVTGLTNGTAYTFAVVTHTQKAGINLTGPATLSTSVTPVNGLVVSPATLALSSLASSHSARTITLVNQSSSPVTLTAVPAVYTDFTPNLPSDVTLSTTCSTSSSLAANGGFCTITITPGTTASSACTTGIAPVASAFEVISGTSINAVVLGYGCQYQGGYLFSIDDLTPGTQSIGGKVLTTTDQASPFPNGISWSPASAYDNIWGIDNASTPTTPSPNLLTPSPAGFQGGQLNCDAVNDGACATHNIQVFYNSTPLTDYAAGLCRQPLTGANNATTCLGGSTCYTDWYLPSTCDLGPWGSASPFPYPLPAGSQTCITGSTNIQNQLVNTHIIGISLLYWSSTEVFLNSFSAAWSQFVSTGQGTNDKSSGYNTRCVRNLTN